MHSSEHVTPGTGTAPKWRKSSHSGGSSGDCLEVGDICTACVPVRDSKNPHGPAVVFGATAWTAFVDSLRAQPIASE
ncbi:DUF397 domain-containing protein [Streptomyces spongiicola]|uniref:DUF397 domain-containing protein n=1 Tax=Streptomyces spongiicola TaxID=1690221 RepID=A0ABM6V5C7_9ACTN|nr:DUF397 domain-containing protein [Streptomyces spongiicola]AWK08939.1 DUF397 domain-containing protein [Streptomyces spongiicola]